MPTFLDRRLQVFVSSTYQDLRLERQAAVEAILASGHIPAGMELFSAGDESQLDVIKQWIDDSDVFLLILGGRYGSIEPTSQESYIEIEYKYALARDKPTFACVIQDGELERRVKACGRDVLETENSAKLRAFRSLVLMKIVRFWNDTKDIRLAIFETLGEFSRRNELIGWVRGDQRTGIEVADELARLSSENAKLRQQLEAERSSFQGCSFEEMKSILIEKGLLNFLVEKRRNLTIGFKGTAKDQETLLELAVSGLIRVELIPPRKGPGLIEFAHRRYYLTDVGHAFLNRLHLDAGEPLPTTYNS